MTPSNSNTLQFGNSNYGTSTGVVTNTAPTVQVPEGGASLVFALISAVVLGTAMGVIGARKAVKSLT